MMKKIEIRLTDDQLEKLEVFTTRNKTKELIIGQMIDHYYGLYEYKNNEAFPVLYSVKEVLELFNITRRTFDYWIVNGKINVIKVDKRIWISQKELNRLLKGKNLKKP